MIINFVLDRGVRGRTNSVRDGVNPRGSDRSGTGRIKGYPPWEWTIDRIAVYTHNKENLWPSNGIHHFPLTKTIIDHVTVYTIFPSCSDPTVGLYVRRRKMSYWSRFLLKIARCWKLLDIIYLKLHLISKINR